ncbi:MAG: EpsG family protein [Cetobacterium sp.]|uniref:EpsG family protein n=1 Tax=Cetobacterium sp. TaxID=2071632 RepID=UPI003F2CDEBC
MLKTISLILILFYFNFFVGNCNKYFRKIYGLLFSILIIIIITNNKWSNDYEAYSGIYFEMPEIYAEYGYVILIKIIKFFNLRFSSVLFFMSIFLLYLLKNIKNKYYILLLYLIYPLVLDLNQIRNTIMIFFIILSLESVYKNRTIKSYIYLIVSISIQSLGYVYIPFYLFFKNKKINTCYKYTGFLYILNTIICIFLYKILINIQRLSILNRVILRAIHYSRSVSYSTLILWTGLFLVDIYIIQNLLKQNKDGDNCFVYYKFILYSGSLIPFFAVVSELNRIYRNIFLIKYIYIFYLIEKNKIKPIRYFLLYFFINIILLFLLYVRGLEIDKTIFSFLI